MNKYDKSSPNYLHQLYFSHISDIMVQHIESKVQTWTTIFTTMPADDPAPNGTKQ